jgi:hypothetical protein
VHPDHSVARAQLAAPGAMITMQLRDGAAARAKTRTRS